jgi:hypothetical protein
MIKFVYMEMTIGGKKSMSLRVRIYSDFVCPIGESQLKEAVKGKDVEIDGCLLN